MIAETRENKGVQGLAGLGLRPPLFLTLQDHRNLPPYKVRCLLEGKEWVGGNMKV